MPTKRTRSGVAFYHGEPSQAPVARVVAPLITPEEQSTQVWSYLTLVHRNLI